MVISARNPVHSVLWLILTFFNAAGLFVLLGAEFVAMLVVVVYVGAVAVLFLFVVMMMDVSIAEVKQGFLQYLPLGALIGVVLLGEIAIVIGGWVMTPEIQAVGLAKTPDASTTSNIAAIGNLLYTDFIYMFQAAGLVLLVAMVGSIMLTLRRRPGVQKQSPAQQAQRRKDETLQIVKVKSGRGI
jgi:NADH-quinone oxidoreductase subunit J